MTTPNRREVAMKIKKPLLLFVLLICLTTLFVACNSRTDTDGNNIDYSSIKSVEVDKSCLEFGFLLSDFDMSKIKLIVTYLPESQKGLALKKEQDEEAQKNGTTITEYDYSVKMNATIEMVKAEDVEKLSTSGRKTITLIYGKFEMSFVLELIDDEEKNLYKVNFYDYDGETRLADIQYVKEGGRAIVPAVNSREGYDFIGWKNKLTGKIETFDNITGDIDFVATYEPSMRKIKFLARYRYVNSSGDPVSEDPAKEIVIDSFELPRGESVIGRYPTPPDIQGYTFSGWETGKETEGESIYYAIYYKDLYDVSFVYRIFDQSEKRYSDSMIVRSVGYYSADRYISAPTDAKCPGEISPANDYQFLGWYVIHDGKRVNVSFPYEMDTVFETTFYGNYVDINAGSSGLSYKSAGTNTCVVSGYNGDESIIVIPEKAVVNGVLCDVSGIDDGVFKNNTVTQYVVSSENKYFSVHNGVLYSKNGDILYAYPAASPVTVFSVLDGVEEISSYAFYMAGNLESITLPDSLLQINDYAFSRCDSLRSVTIPKNVVIIEEGAFRMTGDNAITSVVFEGTKVTELGDEAFFGLNNLLRFDLPASVRSIGDGVFYGMSALQKITAENNSYFTVYNGALYSSDYKDFILYPAQYDETENPELYLHENCQVIKRGAFYNALIACITFSSSCELEAYSIVCPSMEALRFATSSFRVDTEKFEQAFGGFMPSVFYVLTGDNTFDSFADKVNLSYYQLREWQGYKNFSADGYVYSETDEGITILGYNGTATDLFIPEMYNGKGIIAIAPYAFYGNTSITSVSIPVLMRSIGEYAFYGCKSLATVTMSRVAGVSLEKIGDYAFCNCVLLKNVYFENSLVLSSFGKFVFENTPYLKSADQFLIVGGVLVKYSGLSATVNVPASVSIIAADAFKDVGFMTSITFTGNTLRYVDEYAFQNCIGLREIIFPASLRYVADYAFYGCSYLFSVKYGAKESEVTRCYSAYKEAGTYYTNYDAVYESFLDSVSYTLTYQAAANEQYEDYGTSFVASYKLDDTNDIFMGWYFDSLYKEKADFPLHITRSTTIYARYESATYISEGLTYENNQDGYYSVSGYSGSDSYVIIPETYKDLAVTSINDYVFGRNVSYIRLPSRINELSENAFVNSSWYRSYPGDFVLYGDHILVGYKGNAKEVHIPSGVTLVSNGLFRNNLSIERVVLPDSITEIVDDMFYGCANLKSINIGKNIRSIGSRAFYGCTSLESVEIENGSQLTNVAAMSFEGTKWFDSQTDDCIIINNIFYKYCGESSVLHIPEGVVSIAADAFAGNMNLRTVYFPNSLRTLYQRAFANSSISEVRLYSSGSSLAYIMESAFEGCYNLTNFEFSNAGMLSEIHERAFYGCSSLGDVVLPQSILLLDKYAFAYSGVKKVTFYGNGGIKAIGEGAFMCCYYLSYFDLGMCSIMATIGDKAFFECISLATYKSEASPTTKIGADAFYNCRSLNLFSVNSKAIRTIGANAFYNVNNSVFANESTNTMVILGNVLLSYRGSEQRVVIPANIVLLYNSAFEGNTHIIEVSFGSKNILTGINDRVFYGCSNLMSIDFPNSIVSVGDDVMTGTAWYNEKLRSDDFIIIGNTLVKYNIQSVRDAVIPESVSVINKNAFNGMSVYDIKIGTNVTLIKDGAFDGIVPATWTEGSATCRGFTLTMETATPPSLEYEEMFENCYRIYVEDEDVLDTYRLNVDWKVQFDRIKVIERFLLAYSIEQGEGSPIDPEYVHALYSSRPVQTVSTAQKQYEFVGWFVDQNYFNAVQYPLILTRNTTLYAKCVNYNVGSNPESFTLELANDGSGNYTIKEYSDTSDKKVVVITEQAGRKITSITGHLGYIKTDKSLYYSLGAAVDENVYVFNDESIIGEQYYSTATGMYVAGMDYYLRRRVSVTAAMIGMNVSRGTYTVGRRGNLYLATGVYQNSTEYYTLTLMKNCDIYIINPDDPTEFVFYDKSIYLGNNYDFYRRNDTVEEIAFANNCTIETLGENCFAGMVSLKKITLPASLKTIAANAFADCVSLEEIVFSDGISDVVIESYAFNRCTSLVNLTVPEGIKEIKNHAFINCSSLINIYALQEKPFDLKGTMPFDENNGLRIHIAASAFNNYYSAWSAYVDYLNVIEEDQ